MTTRREITTRPEPRSLIVELCRQFYTQGWVSGTGGGMSIRDSGRIYVAPSGVQKERLTESDLFVLDCDGEVLEEPKGAYKISACTPLFMQAYRLRDAGAVLHSHSINALLATLVFSGDRFVATHLEMMKGIEGTGYRDRLEVPIIENTDHECDLADALGDAIQAFPRSNAVLVRRHGVYVWGRDWASAKSQAECYDYLFAAAVRMKQLGFDPAAPPQ